MKKKEDELTLGQILIAIFIIVLIFNFFSCESDPESDEKLYQYELCRETCVIFCGADVLDGRIHTSEEAEYCRITCIKKKCQAYLD